MLIQNRRKVVTFTTLMIFTFLFLTSFTHPSGDDDLADFDAPIEKRNTKIKGEFKARLRIPDHVKSANELHLEIQVSPNDDEFPGVEIDLDRGFSHRMTGVYDVVIRGISVPRAEPDPINSLDEIDREIERFDDAITYLRQMCLSSPYLIVKNPASGIYRDIVADVLVVHGGEKRSIADLMVLDGHALPNSKRWHWGLRIPRPQ